MRNPKVFLFSAPLSLIPAPLLGIPVLEGYLSSNGIDCSSNDLNIRFLQWLIDDRTLLNRFVSEAVEGFEKIQKLPTLTQQNGMHLVQAAASMSLLPPGVIKEHFGSKAIIGWNRSEMPEECGADNNPWKENMPSWAVIMSMIGLAPNDSGFSISEAKASENRQIAFDAFLRTSEASEILKTAAECDLVGISAPFWLQQKEYAYRIAMEIKKLNPKTFVVLGGSGLTIMAKYCLSEIIENGVVDAVSLYQGELSLKMLAESILNGEKADKVPDLILFDHVKKEYKYTEHISAVHPDTLPTPIFSGEDLEMYQKMAENVFSDKRAPLLISRGCYWDKCAFCSDSQCRHPETSPHEVRNPEKVLDDIELLQKLHGITYFYLITSAMPPSWGKKFAKGVLERGITAKFWAYTRAMGKEAADPAYFELLKKAGFDVVTCGVESTSDRVLKAIAKGNGREEITNTIHGLSKAGVRTKFNLIADIPPSTYEDAKLNWDYLIENIPYVNDLAVFTFQLRLGSEMAVNPEKFNIRTITEKDGSRRESYPGTIEHVNPFYEHNRAKELIQRTKNLSDDLQFFQQTKNVRSIIDSPDFMWSGSAVSLMPFTAIPSKFPLYDLKQRNVYIVFLSNMFNYFVVSEEYAGFLEVCRKGVGTPVSYEELQTAFNMGMNASGQQLKGTKSETAAGRVLERMVREGFVMDVKAECLTSMEQRAVPDNGLSSKKFSMSENFPRAFGRYPSTELPFTFGTFPFAMVLSTLMV